MASEAELARCAELSPEDAKRAGCPPDSKKLLEARRRTAGMKAKARRAAVQGG